ncbi:MAG: glycosyltransferase family 39 protein [Candidatus Aminicenantes bacterium]|nr:glycosyltransferase family 39 protein [Candidatus Aminicenantes bacterium]
MNHNLSSQKEKSLSWCFFLALSLIAGTALRIFSVLRESAIGDELFCRSVTLLPWKQSLQAVTKDVVTPPVHYMTYKAWSGVIGHELIELRVLALLFGIAVIIGTVLLGKFVFRDKRVAVLAGILVAGNDLQILFNHFARHYTMYSAIVLILIALFWYAFENPQKWGIWIAFTGLGTILVYTHYVGWLYLLSFSLVVLIKRFRMMLKGYLTSLAIITLLFLPWIMLVLPHYRNRGGLATNLGWVKTPAFGAFSELFVRFSGLPGIYSSLLLFLAVGFFIIVIYGLVALKQSHSSCSPPTNQATLLIATIAIIPPCALFLLARPPVKLPIWGIRHVMPSQALWALLTALGILSIARLKKRIVILFIIVLAVSFQWLPSFKSTMQLRFAPFSEVASYLKEVRGQTERIYTLYSPGRREVINYHLGSSLSVKMLPKNIFKLPLLFSLIYDPDSKAERDKMISLEKLGYSVKRTQSFTQLKYFRSHSTDRWALRVVCLSRGKEPTIRTEKSKKVMTKDDRQRISKDP